MSGGHGREGDDDVEGAGTAAGGTTTTAGGTLWWEGERDCRRQEKKIEALGCALRSPIWR